MEPIILASTSPRRKELLELLGIPLYTIPPTFDEENSPIPKNCSVSEYFAREKLFSVLPLLEGKYTDAQIVVGVDTIIIHNKNIMGKPKSEAEAKDFLRRLSNDTHIVETSIACLNRKTNEIKTAINKNYVHVSLLSERDIDWYISKKEYIDAAGGYKIQGNFQRFISNIEGTQSSVMGLPLFDFCCILESYKYDFT